MAYGQYVSQQVDKLSSHLTHVCFLLQFKQATQQIDAEDIADVLEVQAADAEDAQLDEEPNTEAAAAVKAAAAAEQQNLAVDAKAKSEPRLVQDDSAKANGGLVTRDLPHPLLDGQAAAAVTKDVHEADLDLSHADSAPGEGCCQSCLWCSSAAVCLWCWCGLGILNCNSIAFVPQQAANVLKSAC